MSKPDSRRQNIFKLEERGFIGKCRPTLYLTFARDESALNPAKHLPRVHQTQTHEVLPRHGYDEAGPGIDQ